MPKLARRQLEFRNLGEVRREVDRLAEHGYSHTGNWNLAQTCEHLGIFIKGSIDGLSIKPPIFFRPFGGMIYRYIIRNRRMPSGVKIPDVWVPKPQPDSPEVLDRFRALLKRYENHHGDMARNPLFGKLTKEQWTELHLIHCAHHLSHLLPKE